MEFDPDWKGPLTVERKLTDFPFVIAYQSCLLVWISVGIYAFSAAPRGDDELQTRAAEDIKELNDLSLTLAIITVILVTLMAIGLSIVYVRLVRSYPVKLATIGLVFCVIHIIMKIANVVFDVPQLMSNVAKKENRPKHVNDTDLDSHLRKILLSYAILALLIIVAIIIVVKNTHRIKFRLACEVIRETAKAILDFPSSLLFSIIPLLFQAIVLTFTSFTFYFLVQIQSLEGNERNWFFILLHFINLCGFSWTMSLIDGFWQIALSGSFATWYWNTDKAQVTKDIVMKFIATTYKFHTGTAACGSLIIAVYQLLNQSIFYHIDGMSYLVRYSLVFLDEVLEFVRIIDFVNGSVYVMCIVHGTTFLRSAKDASKLFYRHLFKLLIIIITTAAIVYLGVQLVMDLSKLLAAALFFGDDSGSMAIGTTFALFQSAFVCNIVFRVFAIGVHVIFLSFLEDLTRNDGSSRSPYFMADTLKALLQAGALPAS